MKIDTTMILGLRDKLMEEGQRSSMVLSPAYEALTREGLLSPEESTILSRVDPIAEAMFLMMAADGDLAEEELDVIRGAIRDLTDSRLRSGTIKVMLESYAEKLAKSGWEDRLQEVADHLAQSQAEAETAYTLIAAVALADQEVTLEENDLIDKFAELLKLDDERCCDLLDIVKRRSNMAGDGGA